MKKHLVRNSIVLGIVFVFTTSGFSSFITNRDSFNNTEGESLDLRLTIPPISQGYIHTKYGDFLTLDIIDGGYTTVVGEARLPVITKFIEIPQSAHPSLTITDAMWETTVVSSRIVSVQPSVPKTTNEPENIPFLINDVYYSSNQFLPYSVAQITTIGEIRGHRVAILTVTPVQYNPVTGELKIMTSCTLHLDLPGSDLIKTREHHERYSSSPFTTLCEQLIENYGTYDQTHTKFSERQTEYLMIVYDLFYEEIQPLVQWKQSQGYQVTVTNTSQIPGGPTKEHIKTYIADAYYNWSTPPTYILFVADHPQIPIWVGPASGGATDLYYTTLTPGDSFPDVFLGRFSATQESHVVSMVEKTLLYEQGNFPSPEYLNKAVFMASEDRYWVPEGTHNYVIDTYMDHLWYSSDKLYCHTYHATTQQVINAFNDGRVLAMYSGHGGSTQWSDGPYLNQTHVNSLTNDGKYPFVCSFACGTNGFGMEGECFAETWVRASHKGSFAYWGSSVTTYWNEDDILQRTLYTAWLNDHLQSIGGMTTQAKYLLYQYYGGTGQSMYYLECYNLLGDPSVFLQHPLSPDHNLAVSALNAPGNARPGDQIIVNATIVNNGAQDETNVLISFRVNDVELNQVLIPVFDHVLFQQVSFEWTPPDIGLYTVTVNVSMPSVQEWSYEDNEQYIIVTAGPDVAVTSITAPEFTGIGRLTLINGTVANLGITDEWIDIIFSVNETIEGTQQVYLTNRTATNVSFEWIPTIPGVCTLELAAELTGEEPYTGNNYLRRNITVFYTNGYVLLVDDDDVEDTYETYYETVLTANNYLYDLWHHPSQGTPSTARMLSYDAVIWFTGDDFHETLNPQDQGNLGMYLNQSGRLFLSGQDIGWDLAYLGRGLYFYQHFLHAQYDVDNTSTRMVTGTGGDPIGNGLTFSIQGGDGANNQLWPDGIQAISPGTVVFTYQGTQYKAAVKTDTLGYKVVYFAFGFEAINTTSMRNEVMRRVLEWLIGRVVDPIQSSVTLAPGHLTTCPMGDGPTYHCVTVTVKNAAGTPIPWIPSSMFTFTINPVGIGTHWYGTLSCHFSALDPVTDENGQIRFDICGDTSIYGNITIQVTVQGIALNDLDVLPCKTGDYDTNGGIMLGDFVTFAGDYGRSGWRSDFSGDGIVGLSDFVMFAQHYAHHA